MNYVVNVLHGIPVPYRPYLMVSYISEKAAIDRLIKSTILHELLLFLRTKYAASN